MAAARLAPLVTAPWIGRQSSAGARSAHRTLLLSQWLGTPGPSLRQYSLAAQQSTATSGATAGTMEPVAADSAHGTGSVAEPCDRHYMQLALEQAQLAFDAGEVPVGAVLVSASGEVLAAAHNSTEASSDPTAHAELLCIRQAATSQGAWRLLDATLFVTLEPCPMCAGALLQSRVGTLVYGARNTLLGADGSWIAMLPTCSCGGKVDSSEPGGSSNNSSSSNDSTSSSSDGCQPTAVQLPRSDTLPLPAPSAQPSKPHPFHPSMAVRRGVLAAECGELMRQFFALPHSTMTTAPAAGGQKSAPPLRVRQYYRHPHIAHAHGRSADMLDLRLLIIPVDSHNSATERVERWFCSLPSDQPQQAMAQAADGAQPQEGAPDTEGEQTGAAPSRGLNGGEAVLSTLGRGAGASQGTSWVHDCWELATDMNSGQQYYFNRASGTSQWHPPPGWAPSPFAPPSAPQMQGCAGPPAAAPAEAAAAADPGEAGGAQQAQHPQQEEGGSYEPGYYYRDAFGQLQGPFDLDQLREWRGMLAMDLPILRLELPAGSSDAKDGTPGSDGGSKAAAGATPSAPATAAGSWSQSDLADLLGDDELLAHWRMQNPEQASHCPVATWPGTAPSAAAYEAERQRGTAHSLAEAVLFGLPAHDEAVSMARMAALSGKSIQEVMEWSRAQVVDYSSTAYRVAARGRIQAPGAAEPLYAEFSRWANPHEMEAQLAKAAERRKRALTGQELRQEHIDVSDVLDQVGEVLSGLVEGSSASSHASDSALPNLWSQLQSIKQRVDDNLTTLAVMALAKSGKSTLINGLMGQKLLPSNNVPETARITSIEHQPPDQPPALTYQAPDGQTVTIQGTAHVHEHLRQLNSAARGGEQGLVASEQPLRITAAIAALVGLPTAALGGRISILDTPGPNESGEDHLRFKVERLMESVDAVLYLLDYSKLKTCEEAAMLQRLHELNPNLLRRLCTRCFFCVNKLDMAEAAEGMDEDETREYVATLVTQQLNIFLVSARDALFARLVLCAEPNPADEVMFRKIAFGKRWKGVTDPAIIRQTAEMMLAESGLPELEAGVMGFLGTRAAVLHQVAILDDIERLLAQMHNLTSATAASLHQGVTALSAQIQSLSSQLADTLAQFESVKAEVQDLEGMVVDEVRERMGILKLKLTTQINQVLDRDRLPTGIPHGRWPAVWSMAKALFPPRRGGGGKGSADEKEAQQELQMKLSELHSMVYLQIEAETRDFWHTLEQATNQRQRSLFDTINGHMQALSQAIEAEVEGTLHCALEPVDMRLKPPTAEQFHANLTDLLQRGIKKEVSQEVEHVEVNHVEHEKRTGLCKHEWWEPVTKTRVEERSVQRTRYLADVQAIKAYFLSMVDGSITNSVKAVRAYVKMYLADRVEEARRRLASYAAQYTAVMEDCLATARLGEGERTAALHLAEARCIVLCGLIENVQDLQQRAEEMLGGWVDELEAAEASPPPAAAATMAALAALQVAPGPLLSTSQLSSGSTAAEVMQMYAQQAVAAGDAAKAATSDHGLEAGLEGGVEAEAMAEVELELEEGASHGTQQGGAADADADAEAAAAAGGGSEDEDAGWTVVSGEAGAEADVAAHGEAGADGTVEEARLDE
ncbi:tRNA(adenine(34)) deaminase [Chlorella vulgaris]